MFKQFSLTFLFSILTLSLTFGQTKGIPSTPSPKKLVNNLSKEFPNFITTYEANLLEQKLERFSDSTSNQIAIVIVDDLAGFEPWEFATRLGEEWGIGQKGKDNGIVILLKPTGGKNQRKFFIAVGRGLEGVIPDATAKLIQDRELVPFLKTGEYFKALDQTTNVLMQLAKGEFNSKEYNKKKRSNKGLIKAIMILVLIFIFFIIRFKNGGNGGNDGLTMGAAGFLFGSGLGRSSGGFGGGSSGGGFGGFGGGGFGGGGSGGSW